MAFFFIDSFANAVARFGGKHAAVCQGDYLTFSELDSLSNAIAGALQNRGIRRGDIVPINLDPGIAPLAAIIGVWKAGAAFCPLATDLPMGLVRQIASECSARLILDRAWLDRQTLNQEPLVGTVENLPSFEDLAMVFFNPDPSGRYRGTMIPHRTLSLAIQGNARDFSDQDAFLSNFPFNHIGMVFDTLTPVALGATTHLTSGSLAEDLRSRIHYIKDNAITVAGMVPHEAAAYLNRADGDLKTLFVGMNRIGGLFSVFTRIVNVYGLAETCGPVAALEIDRPYLNAPIGQPYEGTQIHLLDDKRDRVADGELGEVCLSGQIAMGYLNDPDSTERSFIDNPYALGVEDRKLFCTGDLGRIDPDSGLLFVEGEMPVGERWRTARG